MIRIQFFAWIMLVGMALTGCSQSTKNGSQQLAEMDVLERAVLADYRDSEEWGQVIGNELDLPDFSSVRTEGHVEIVYTQGDACSVKVFGNEKAIAQYAFDVDEETEVLNIKLDDYDYDGVGYFSARVPGITVLITTPVLERMEVYGAGDVDIDSELVQEEGLCIVVSGKGDVETRELDVQSLDIEINGSGDVKVKKATCSGNIGFKLNGRGDLVAKVKCKNASIEVNGEGDVDLKVKCKVLNATCFGRGDVELSGECKTLNKKDGAAGSINSRELKVDKINLI